MVTRYSFPRLVRVCDRRLPILAFSESVSDLEGFATIYAYAALTLRGFRRIWAF